MKVFIVLIVIFISQNLFATDLTISQQIERLNRAVSDLSKEIYNESPSGNNLKANLTAIDLRIYDLENDIKNINFNLEELMFVLDDLTQKFDQLETQMIMIESKVLQNN
tara:strand:+ start:88 stop:414 length:327 start_codon:yes stop_codon:yes gene_type:complete